MTQIHQNRFWFKSWNFQLLVVKTFNIPNSLFAKKTRKVKAHKKAHRMYFSLYQITISIISIKYSWLSKQVFTENKLHEGMKWWFSKNKLYVLSLVALRAKLKHQITVAIFTYLFALNTKEFHFTVTINTLL